MPHNISTLEGRSAGRNSKVVKFSPLVAERFCNFFNAHQYDISFTVLNPLISRFYNFILRRMRIARRRLRQKGADLRRSASGSADQPYIFVLLEHEGGGIE
jgi:hypothetical protein